MTYSTCPIVNKECIITSKATLDRAALNAFAGSSAVVEIWLDEIGQDTGKERFINSRSFRSVTFNPSRTASRRGKLHLNLFAGAPYDKYIKRDDDGAIIYDETLTQPALDFIQVVHANGSKTRCSNLIYYLSKMVYTREKMATALLFYGAKGAGKDILFELLLAKMYGSYYIKKGGKNVDKVHNGELAHKLFGLWSEIEVTSDSIQKVKDMFKSKTVSIRAMYKDDSGEFALTVAMSPVTWRNVCDASFARTRNPTTSLMYSRRTTAMSGARAVRRRISTKTGISRCSKSRTSTRATLTVAMWRAGRCLGAYVAFVMVRPVKRQKTNRRRWP